MLDVCVYSSGTGAVCIVGEQANFSFPTNQQFVIVYVIVEFVPCAGVQVKPQVNNQCFYMVS